MIYKNRTNRKIYHYWRRNYKNIIIEMLYQPGYNQEKETTQKFDLEKFNSNNYLHS